MQQCSCDEAILEHTHWQVVHRRRDAELSIQQCGCVLHPQST